MEAVLRDVRYALRGLRRKPGLAAIAVLTLALGVAANTAVFSVLEALILRPLPISQPESVFFVQGGGFTLSFPNYRDLRDRNRTLSHLAGYRVASMAVDAGAGAAPTWDISRPATTSSSSACNRPPAGSSGPMKM